MNLTTKKGKLSIPFTIVWALPQAASGVALMLLGYVTYYATNVLGLPPALVGTLLLGSKIFDGITDILAGFIIDKTNTKIGRGRPYDFAYAGLALFTPILFSIPKMGTAGTAAVLFIIYFIIFSIFQTLYGCAGPVYLARAVEGKDFQITVNTVSTLLTAASGMGMGIIVPQILAEIGTDRAEWSKFAWKLMIPCVILSLVRVFLIKERSQSDVKTAQKMDLKSSAGLLIHNKYVLVYAGALLFANIASNLSQSHTYYFQYIVGDIGKMSLFSVGSMVAPLSMMFFPALTKRMGLKKLMIAGLICGVIGSLMPMAGPENMAVLVISNAFRGISTMPVFALSANAVIDCMDYGEWKFGKRGEGIYSCILGFCTKVGIGLASWSIGMITALGGFDGTAATQTPSALFSIRFLFTVFPAFLLVGAMICLHFYTLDKELPRIRKELEERKAGNAC